jgi:hypothetical protein
VSKICKTIDEKFLPTRATKDWTIADIDEAIRLLIKEKNSLFDDIVKNLENNQDLYFYIKSIVLGIKEYKFKARAPIAEIAAMYGLIDSSETEMVKIHNKVFEEVITDYLIEKYETEDAIPMINTNKNDYINGNKQLDFKRVLLKFQEFIKANYSKSDILKSDDFLEKELRLVFLSFTKSIINGHGFAFREAQTGEEKRLDVIVVFKNEKFVVELKIWHGESHHKKGLKQLKKYMELESVKQGFMLIMNKNQKKRFYHEVQDEILMVYV